MQSEQELKNLLAQVDKQYGRCKEINPKGPVCYNAQFEIYALAAWRAQMMGNDPSEELKKAKEGMAEGRKTGGSFVDVEQHDALLSYMEASRKVRDKQDPSAALEEMGSALKRCFAIAAKDMMCQTLATKKAWAEGEWLELRHKKSTAVLKDALTSAQETAKSPETYPDAWQVLGETELRVARAQKRPKQREPHIAAGLEAVGKALAINPRLALGRMTEGELYMLRAETTGKREARREAAQSAVSMLDRMLKDDPALKTAYAPLLTKAQALSRAQ
jgi:hypothetical protein